MFSSPRISNEAPIKFPILTMNQAGILKNETKEFQINLLDMKFFYIEW